MAPRFHPFQTLVLSFIWINCGSNWTYDCVYKFGSSEFQHSPRMHFFKRLWPTLTICEYFDCRHWINWHKHGRYFVQITFATKMWVILRLPQSGGWLTILILYRVNRRFVQSAYKLSVISWTIPSRARTSRSCCTSFVSVSRCSTLLLSTFVSLKCFIVSLFAVSVFEQI